MLSDDVQRIAHLAAAHAATGQQVSAVLPVESARGERVYLCAFTSPDEWLALGEDGTPIANRERVREAASIAALVELAEDAVQRTGDEPRVASLQYLDSLGVDSSIVGAVPALEELMHDIESSYKLELGP